jgi:hypothetical protein
LQKERFMNYLNKFTAKVNELLGGEEMANEFFKLHPELVTKMRVSALYHQSKGGASWKGAMIFHRFDLRPILAADRRRACNRPIPKII